MTSPTYKEGRFGFVILCPERNLGGLKNTVKSLKQAYPGSPYLCVVGNDATKAEIAEFNLVCDTFKGKDTITSLINLGIKKSKIDWNVLIFAGSWLRPSLHRKFDLFVKSEKDILFPVVDRKTNFVDGSMNGIMLHKKTFQEVGEFATAPMQKAGSNDLELIKLFWTLDAIEKGCTFKAIMGMKVC